MTWQESSDNTRQPIKEQRYQFANKCPYSKNYGFPVFIYGCESCTVKKSECQRTDAFDCGAGEDS